MKDRVKHLNGVTGHDSFDTSDSNAVDLRSAWIKANYLDCSFLAKRKVDGFRRSVLTLGSVVTGLCVAGKWDQLLDCLEKAASGGNTSNGAFAEHVALSHLLHGLCFI